MKKILFITFPLIMLTCVLQGQSTTVPNYKNSVSLDIGNLVMVNYHRRIFTKGRYVLNGQIGLGGVWDDIEGLLPPLNLNIYLNNIFMLKKHKLIAGIGGQTEWDVHEIMCKIGYEYALFKRISVNATIYQWIWETSSFQDPYTNETIKFTSFIWDSSYLGTLYSFGLVFNF